MKYISETIPFLQVALDFSIFQFYSLFSFSVVSQDYETHSAPESVMIQNDVLLKCAIPSFVSDFVSVEAWVDSEAEIYYMGDHYGTELKLLKISFLE